jgi:hypothetical protein
VERRSSQIHTNTATNATSTTSFAATVTVDEGISCRRLARVRMTARAREETRPRSRNRPVRGEQPERSIGQRATCTLVQGDGVAHRRDDVAGAGRPNLNQALLSLEEEGLPPPRRPSYSGFWLTCLVAAVVGLVIWYVRTPSSGHPGQQTRIGHDEHECAYRAALRDMERQLDDCSSERSRCGSKLTSCESDLSSCESEILPLSTDR